MKTIHKLASLLLMPGALATAPAIGTAAGGVKTIDLDLDLVQVQFQTAQDVNRDGAVAYKLDTRYKGKGRPGGQADGVGFSEVSPEPGDPAACPSEFTQPFALTILIYEDTLVFRDLSTLSIAGSGLFCFDIATFQGVATVNASAVGGTGRFAGATGSVQLDFPQVVNRYMEYSVTTGTLKGTVQVGAD
jgi:hypothetical protein